LLLPTYQPNETVKTTLFKINLMPFYHKNITRGKIPCRRKLAAAPGKRGGEAIDPTPARIGINRQMEGSRDGGSRTGK
jgi:hypothetical protein